MYVVVCFPFLSLTNARLIFKHTHTHVQVRAVLADIVDKVVLENMSTKAKMTYSSRKRSALRFSSNETLSPRHVRVVPKGMKECPVLRGEFRWDVENYVCVWTGQWAISEEAFARGQKCVFRYVSQPTYRCLHCGKDCKSRHGLQVHKNKWCSSNNFSDTVMRFPVSGTYSGHFWLMTGNTKDDKRTIRVEEKRLRIRFSENIAKDGWTMQGKGKNGWGSFELSGYLDSKTNILKSQKRYVTIDKNSTVNKNTTSKARRSLNTHTSFLKKKKKTKNLSESIVVKLKRKRHFVDKQGKRYIVMKYLSLV